MSRRAAGSFSPSRLFWLFLSQVLSPEGSCRAVVLAFAAAQALLAGKKKTPKNKKGKARKKSKAASCATGGYCKARSRLKLARIEALHAATVERIRERVPWQPRWHGRAVKVVDGSSVSMPDTRQNQERYPQPRSQAVGCGFPVMHIVAVFCLSSGLLLNLAKGTLKVSERALLRELAKHFEPGDVILADRGFCSYAEFHRWLALGVDCVMRNHQRRAKGVAELKRLGPNDRLVNWLKTGLCPAGMSQQDWRALPATMTVREIAVTVDIPGFRTQTLLVVTTLLDAAQFHAADFAELYRARWRAELYLRNIKTALGMDVLRCQTPDMIEKELWMHLIAYNLVRALMAKAAHSRALTPDRLSFTGAMDTIRAFAPRMAAADVSPRQRKKLFGALIACIANDTLPNRPDRAEPRAKKRRPKQFQLLNKPRKNFREIPHRNQHKSP